MVRFAFLLLLSLFALAPPAAAQDTVARGAPADFVEELPIPAPRPARLREVEDGIYYLLLDSQVKSDGTDETFYTRNVYKVTDRTGLEEAARFEIDYDPSQEHVVLHHIRVIRNGVAADRMTGADIEVLRREQELDKGIFDGRKTIHIEIKDVRVGDIVDYAYSWDSHSTFWPGAFFGHVTTNWAVPLELMRYRLIWPSDRPLIIRNRSTTLKPTRTRSGGDTIYEWRMVDAEPSASEDGTPQWFAGWGKVALSSMARWADVVAWALPLYSGNDALPPELAARADAIAKKFPRPEDRITEAMRLVEDDLRYVSLSIGAGSYTPRSPTEVFRSGFGDCKDKSQLLVALLRHLGVEAYVALTDMDEGQGLPSMAPAANVFDHAIVQVRLQGRAYWLDPTGSNEGGRFPNLAALNYGWALPVAPGQTRLERIAPPAAPAPTYRTVERYELSRGDNPALTLNVETTYLALEADSMRGQIASKSQAQLESDYLKFYAGMYPGIVRARPIHVVDDRDANKIVVMEAYQLSPSNVHRGKLLEKFLVKASSMDTYDKIPSGKRATPYALPWPVNKEHVIVVVTPGRRPPAPRAVSFSGAGFSYAMDVARDGNTLTLDYHLIGIKDVLGAADVDSAADDANAVSDDNYWYLDLTSHAGGTMGDAGAVKPFDIALYVLAAIGLAALVSGAVFALRRGLHGDDAWAASGFYYPVSAGEFLLMNVLTAGLFAIFWMWKCWRWAKLRGGRADILPFWRSVFGWIWLYPLFADAAKRAPVPAWLRFAGLAAAVLYPVWLIGANLAVNLRFHPLLGVAFAAAAPLCFLPVLSAVNRLNGPEIVAANSKMTRLTLVAIGFGVAYWLLTLFSLLPNPTETL